MASEKEHKIHDLVSTPSQIYCTQSTNRLLNSHFFIRNTHLTYEHYHVPCIQVWGRQQC